jgi:hypothetical protein
VRYDIYIYVVRRLRVNNEMFGCHLLVGCVLSAGRAYRQLCLLQNTAHVTATNTVRTDTECKNRRRLALCEEGEWRLVT